MNEDTDIIPIDQMIHGGDDDVVPIDQMIGQQKQSQSPYPQRNFLKDAGNTAMGALEGATFGIPRAITEKVAGAGVKLLAPGDEELYEKVTNLPRGNTAGQVIGGFATGGALLKGMSKLPALGKVFVESKGLLGGGKTIDPLIRRLTRGAIVGSAVGNTPLVTEPDAPIEDRLTNTALGAGTGAAGEAVIPPVVKGVSNLLQGKTGIQRALNKLLGQKAKPSKGIPAVDVKESYGEMFKSRAGQIKRAKTAVNESVDKEIGMRIAPSSEDLYKNRLRSMEADALRHAGLDQKQIDDVLSYKSSQRASTAPTIEEANASYKQVMDKVPNDYKLDVADTAEYLEGILKEKDILDAQGRYNPPAAGKDNSAITALHDAYITLKNRINMNKNIPNLLNQTEMAGQLITDSGDAIMLPDTLNLTSNAKAGINKALRNPDQITKAAYLRAYGNLKGALTGVKELDAPIMATLQKLRTNAENAGIEGLKEVHHMRRVAEHLEPAYKQIDSKKGEIGEALQTLIKKSTDKKNTSARELLLQKVGPQGMAQVDEQAEALLRAKQTAERESNTLRARSRQRQKLLRKKYGPKAVAGKVAKYAAVGSGLYGVNKARQVIGLGQ